MFTSGTNINNNVIQDYIGEGSFGVVFSVFNTASQKMIALKHCKENASSESINDFRKENTIQARLKHENIIEVLSQIESFQTTLYYLMELADLDLEKLLMTSSFINDQEKLVLFLKICSAVKFAHDNKTVHRDLHWKNILIKKESNKNEPKIADFGLGKDFTILDRTLIPMDKWGAPFFRPPEIHFKVWDIENLDHYILSDIYALGLVLYYIFFGEPGTFATAFDREFKVYIYKNNININALDPAARMDEYFKWISQLPNNFVESTTPILLLDLKLQQLLRTLIDGMLCLDYTKRYSNLSAVIDIINKSI